MVLSHPLFPCSPVSVWHSLAKGWAQSLTEGSLWFKGQDPRGDFSCRADQIVSCPAVSGSPEDVQGTALLLATAMSCPVGVVGI